MNLTVGPLPPAVYWRRRAVMAGTLLLLVIVLVYSCSGRSGTAQSSGRTAAVPASKTPTSTPTASASTPVFTPSGAISQPPGDPDPPASDPPASNQPAVATGPCTDAEMTVTAIPEVASAARGTFVKLTLRIKNISDRTCTRDVGADAQELYLQDAAKAKIWSSDACDATHGTDVRTFKPAIEAEFFVTWDGRTTTGGCANRPFPAAGKYQLVGRLAAKVGEPGSLELK
jgi:hypothetical protein